MTLEEAKNNIGCTVVYGLNFYSDSKPEYGIIISAEFEHARVKYEGENNISITFLADLQLVCPTKTGKNIYNSELVYAMKTGNEREEYISDFKFLLDDYPVPNEYLHMIKYARVQYDKSRVFYYGKQYNYLLTIKKRNDKMKFLFGDIIVVNKTEIGVIVKSWGSINNDGYHYEVYNRMTNRIQSYKEIEIERYKVRHKYLNEEELGYQNQ